MQQRSDHWISASTIATKEGVANLPQGTQAISIAFQDKMGQWRGACQVIPATKLCKDKDCDEHYTIQTRWSVDGTKCILME